MSPPPRPAPDFQALAAYTREVLAFALGQDPGPAPALEPAGPETPDPEALARRCLKALARSGRSRLALLGLGSGRVAAALDRLLPAQALLAVYEPDPALARRVLAGQAPAWASGQGRAVLLADTSAWAALMLLTQHGLGPDQALILENPELSPGAKGAVRPLRRLLARTRVVPGDGPDPALALSGREPGPTLSFGAILRPDEPGLAQFLAAVPPLAREAVIVWDAPDLPGDIPPLPVPAVHLARPLGGDFSAQRNAMLAACRGDWVLTLDGDERLCPRLTALLPALLARTDVSGYCFQRRTLYPDPSRCKIGYGLWPDPQLRLYRRLPGLHYERPVHEVLAGLAPPLGLPLSGAILHHNHLGRTDQDLREKLRLFDRAGSGTVRHALSREYPSLALDLLDPPGAVDSPGLSRLALLDLGRTDEDQEPRP